MLVTMVIFKWNFYITGVDMIKEVYSKVIVTF